MKLDYTITAVSDNKAKIGKISTFVYYKKPALPDGIQYPDLSISGVFLNDERLELNDDYVIWVEDDWDWRYKTEQIDRWVDLGSFLTATVELMLDAGSFPHRGISVETNVSI
ncbi:MAG: hypothetical protein ACI4QV_02020 [Acutalibacteraceae bacterium]